MIVEAGTTAESGADVNNGTALARARERERARDVVVTSAGLFAAATTDAAAAAVGSMPVNNSAGTRNTFPQRGGYILDLSKGNNTEWRAMSLFPGVSEIATYCTTV